MTNDTTWYPGMSLDAVEKIVIEKCLRYTSGNKTQTAQMLGISVRGLDGKMERHGLQKPSVETKETKGNKNDKGNNT